MTTQKVTKNGEVTKSKTPTYQQFVELFIKTKRTGESKGVNTTYSGLNNAIEVYYKSLGIDLTTEAEEVTFEHSGEKRTYSGGAAIVQRLIKEDKIDYHVNKKDRNGRGSIQIFIKGEMGGGRNNKAQAMSILKEMGLA